MILVMCYNHINIYAMAKAMNCVANDTREERQEWIQIYF